MSETNLYAALVKARSEIPPIPKDGTNPHFRNKFATLDAILAAVVPTLAKHGLVIVQPVRGNAVETAVYHESGDCITSAYPLPDQPDPQKLGAAVTYARRYSLCALLGIVADEDDDGNSASAAPRARRQDPPQAHREPRGEAQAPPPTTEPKPVSVIPKGRSFDRKAALRYTKKALDDAFGANFAVGRLGVLKDVLGRGHWDAVEALDDEALLQLLRMDKGDSRLTRTIDLVTRGIRRPDDVDAAMWPPATDDLIPAAAMPTEPEDAEVY